MAAPQGQRRVIGRDGPFLPTRSENVFIVDPPVVEVKLGETLEILIDSPESFSVFLPYQEIFGKEVILAEDASGWINDKPKHKWWGVRMTRKLDIPPVKEMPYCIYSKELNNFAVGNSPPKMDLDP